MRNFNEAVYDAERSIALKPDYAKAHARLGLAKFLLGHYEYAVKAYTKAVQLEPNNKSSIQYLEKSKKNSWKKSKFENVLGFLQGSEKLGELYLTFLRSGIWQVLGKMLKC